MILQASPGKGFSTTDEVELSHAFDGQVNPGESAAALVLGYIPEFQ